MNKLMRSLKYNTLCNVRPVSNYKINLLGNSQSKKSRIPYLLHGYFMFINFKHFLFFNNMY